MQRLCLKQIKLFIFIHLFSETVSQDEIQLFFEQQNPFFRKLPYLNSQFMNLAETPIKDNAHKSRFELDYDNKLAVVDYQKLDDETLALTHTEVDPSLEGGGVGSHLVKGVLEYADRNNLRIVPLCPFIGAYLKRHPEWSRLVSTSYNARDL